MNHEILCRAQPSLSYSDASRPFNILISIYIVNVYSFMLYFYAAMFELVFYDYVRHVFNNGILNQQFDMHISHELISLT